MEIGKKHLIVFVALVLTLQSISMVVAFHGSAVGRIGHDITEISGFPECLNTNFFQHEFVLTTDANGLKCVTDQVSTGGNQGTVESLTQGTGIDLDPATITTTGLIGINFNDVQARVTGTCPAGQAMQSVGSTGQVTCQPVVPTVCVWNGVQYSPGAFCRIDDCRTGGSDERHMGCTATGSWGPPNGFLRDYGGTSCVRSCPN